MIHYLKKRRINNIHFIGIGGSGMSGIAEVLLNQNYKISGSDKAENAAVIRLRNLGAQIVLQHDADNIVNADVVVISSAIDESNPELLAARKARIPVLPRAQMLAELMRFRDGIAIAGTHGKTTTTSLVASILAEGGLDPTFVVGGLLNSIGSHARLGKSNYFVVEADESDASFLLLNPAISIITNIDFDHMQTYGNDFNRLKKAFLDFIHRLPFYGLAIVCIDDPVVREILPKIARPVITYGFSQDADVRAISFRQIGLQSCFRVESKLFPLDLDITLNLAGKHNVLNALAALSVAKVCDISDSAISNSLQQFCGIGRRMQVQGYIEVPEGKVMVIDDYGHHPKEIKVTLDALRGACPDRRLVLIFQPHRYTRTQSLFDDFAAILSQVDVLMLLEIYAAGEKPIVGVNSRTLAASIRQRGRVDPIYVEHIDEIPRVLANILRDGDILLLQGAGNIGTVSSKLMAKFEHEKNN